MDLGEFITDSQSFVWKLGDLCQLRSRCPHCLRILSVQNGGLKRLWQILSSLVSVPVSINLANCELATISNETKSQIFCETRDVLFAGFSLGAILNLEKNLETRFIYVFTYLPKKEGSHS